MIAGGMQVLVAPDKLKGSLSSSAAAEAMARGVEAAGARATPLPLADGGEGTLDVLERALGGTEVAVQVTNALGRSLVAPFLWLPDSRTAVIESARAIGLGALGSTPKNVMGATSRGLGELVRAALDHGAERIVVALGGSATHDGGVGAALELGVAFGAAPAPFTPFELAQLGAADIHTRDRRIADVELVALVDVQSPLFGPRGAAQVFAAQKGASASDIAELERGTRALARANPHVDPEQAGMGAAGGLGFGLAAFLGARLVSGADWILDQVGFDALVREAELVITAEGSLDAQSLEGKLVARVADRARQAGIPTLALAGRVLVPGAILARHGIAAAFALAPEPLAEADAITRAAEHLARGAEHLVRVWTTARSAARLP